MEALLELRGLRRTYRSGLLRRSVTALSGLDLSVRRGEIYGLVGPNGAGKTTTFKIILGLLRPTAGGGTLLGRRLGDREARAYLGFLPELPAYYPHLTVGEVLRFARALSGARQDSREDLRLLEELKLGHLAERRLGKLSKGQIQRVGLAQALVHRPDLLILDEPMSGLDPLGRSLVKDRLRRERAMGRTILLSSHVLSDVEALADTVGLMAEGRLLVEGAPHDLLRRSAIEVVVEGSGELPSNILVGLPEGSTCSGDARAWVLRMAEPEQAQVDACLRRILKEGGNLHGVETRQDDLESFFLRALAEEKTA